MPDTDLTVFVRGLALDAEIGVYPHERGRAQPLTVDIEVRLSNRPIAHLADTVNYEGLAAAARALAAEGHIELVETYAERLVSRLLDNPKVTAARVRVEKPEAIQGARAAGVEVSATKS